MLEEKIGNNKLSTIMSTLIAGAISIGSYGIMGCESSTPSSLSTSEEENTNSTTNNYSDYNSDDSANQNNTYNSGSSTNNSVQQTDPTSSEMKKISSRYGLASSIPSSCPPDPCYQYSGSVKYTKSELKVVPYVIVSNNERAVPEQRIQNDILALNSIYAKIGISFKLYKTELVQNTAFWHTTIADLDSILKLGEKYEGYYPIIYVRSLNYDPITKVGKYAGVVPSIGGWEGMVLAADTWETSGIIIHEMGHELGLHHTFEELEGCGGDICLPPLTVSPPYPTDCHKTGDFVCDTPPDARDGVSCVQQQEKCAPDISNYMSYYGCKDRFSDGQWKTMSCFLDKLVKK